MLLSHDDVGLHVLGLLSHIKFFLLWALRPQFLARLIMNGRVEVMMMS